MIAVAVGPINNGNIEKAKKVLLIMQKSFVQAVLHYFFIFRLALFLNFEKNKPRVLKK